MKLDLHIHTKFSGDSKLEPKDIIKQAKVVGLDGVAITDHNTLRGALEAEKVAGGFPIIKGAEIRTDRGEIIGYFLEKEIESREFWQVVDEIKSQGGIVSVPHLFDPFRVYRLKLTGDLVKAFDCVEVLNSRCAFDDFNEKAKKFAEDNELASTAGSDSHFIFEIGNAGIEVDSVEDFRALKNIKVFGKRANKVDLMVARMRKSLKL